jgi:hypothetical protein
MTQPNFFQFPNDNALFQTLSGIDPSEVDELDQKVAIAEFDVLSYYTPHPRDFANAVYPDFFPAFERPIFLQPQLQGWEGDGLDEPDIAEMDDVLVLQIRRAIAERFNTNEEEDLGDVDLIVEGERRVRRNLNHSESLGFTKHLRKFDDRTPHSFL